MPLPRRGVAVSALCVLLLTSPLWAPPAGVAALPPATAVRPPVAGAVVRPFDPPQVPWGSGHRGVDLAADEESVVLAPLEGTVSYAGTINGVGWVTLDHGQRLDTTYGDLDALVRRGQRIRAGQPIGTLSLGRRHLDWGARLDGDYIDPLLLLLRWELHLTTADRVPTGRVIPVD